MTKCTLATYDSMRLCVLTCFRMLTEYTATYHLMRLCVLTCFGMLTEYTATYHSFDASVCADLLEDADEAGHQVLVGPRVVRRHLRQRVERRRHHRRVLRMGAQRCAQGIPMLHAAVYT